MVAALAYLPAPRTLAREPGRVALLYGLLVLLAGRLAVETLHRFL